MSDASRPALVELTTSDPPSSWAELGFHVDADVVELGRIRLRLGADGDGIVGWTLSGVPARRAIDGLPTTVVQAPTGDDEAAAASHPNGAIGLDHVVVTTPSFDRTAAELAAAGMPLRRIRTASRGSTEFRQGFRRLGPAILELVEITSPGPARFWGLVVIVTDIDAIAERLGPDRCGAPQDAVQPGRRIATLRRAAGLGMPVAFMTPDSD